MSFVYAASVTSTADATGGLDAYCSTYLNGVVNDVYVKANKAASTATTIKIVGEYTTSHVILHIANPSTLGEYYYPSHATISTGAVTASTFGLANCSLYKERPRVLGDSSSGFTSVEVRVHVI